MNIKKVKNELWKPGELQKSITVEYVNYLGSYLDDMGIEWEYVTINDVGQFVKINFRRGMSHSDIFNFTVDFCQWRYNMRGGDLTGNRGGGI